MGRLARRSVPRPAARLSRQRPQAVQRSQHQAGLGHRLQAQRGRHRAAAFAQEQRRAHAVFQLGDGLAGARLGHADLGGGVGDAAGVGHRLQQPPMDEVHHGISSSYTYFLIS